MPRPAPVLWLFALSLFAAEGRAEGYFDPRAFDIDNPAQQPVDLSQFDAPGGQLPGSYHVDIVLNLTHQATRDVNFVRIGNRLEPQFTPAELAELGVNVAGLPLLRDLPPDAPVAPLADYIPDASTQFDFARQRLTLSVPQVALRNTARGTVPPERWDNGVPALLANYNATGQKATHRDSGAPPANSYYLNLLSGANWGAWRLRNYSTYMTDNEGSDDGSYRRRWDTLRTWLQRDIPALQGELVMGDGATSSDIFDSVPFRGLLLASADDMLPDSRRGFAPVVRGIARSNARVTIRQNGNVIDQRYVPPGAFVIDDLYPTSSGGTLAVTVTEADGSEQHFTQAFAAVPMMQREGHLDYEGVAGAYHASYGNYRPGFGQVTLRYGFPHAVTGYGGVLVAEDYQSALLGVGLGLGYAGSVSLDAAQARTTLPAQFTGETQRGAAFRLQYNKVVELTNTSLTLAATRYASQGYFSFADAADIHDRQHDDGDWLSSHNRRGRLQVNLNQPLGRDGGSLYLSAYQQQYWGTGGYERNLNVGYSTTIKRISLSLSYAWVQSVSSPDDDDDDDDNRQTDDRQFSLTVQVPLDGWLPGAYASYSATTDAARHHSQQVGLNGNALEDGNLSYTLQAGHDNQYGGSSGLATVDYRSTYGEAGLGYNYDSSGSRANYRLQGSAVATPYGAALGQPVGETLALVHAPGARGVKIRNNVGVHTDPRGYLVVPYLAPYRENRLVLDTTSLPENTDLPMATKTVVPTKGAVVLAAFATHLGYRVVVTLTHDGQPLPFGAVATLAGDPSVTGIVGDGGELYLSGVPPEAEIVVKWGNGAQQACRARLSLPEEDQGAPVRSVQAACR
jgi:outer membrane usher protein